MTPQPTGFAGTVLGIGGWTSKTPNNLQPMRAAPATVTLTSELRTNTMALASQSIPSNDRRRITFSQRRLLTPKVVGTLSVAGAVILGSWWLLRPDGGADSAQTTGEGLAGLNGGAEATDLGGGNPLPPASKLGLPPVTPPAGGNEDRRASTDTPGGKPSLRSLVADDRAAGESSNGAGAIEMGTKTRSADPRAGMTSRQSPPAGTPPAAPPPSSAPSVPPTANPPANQPAPQTTPPATPPTAPAATPNSPPASTGISSADLAKAYQLQTADPIAARSLVTRALDGGSLSASDRDRGYELVNALGKSLFLSTNVNPNDPVMKVHTIAAGESLAKVVRNEGLACETSLLKRINGIKDERRIQIGQKLRVPKGAFHAEVIKSEFRFNLYLDAGEGSTERVMVASLRCGLGESNGTPTGLFKVRPRSKLIDPEWTHPKTGEHFSSNDPKNPIGEHWIGIMGVEEKNKDLMGYGIHGTVDPESIGHERSLGCIRMLADDIAFVYECLTEPQSTIRIK